MSESVSWGSVFPLLATLFGALASALMGMAIAKLGGIESHLAKINGRLTEHVENKDLHYAAQAKTEMQILNLLNTVKVAHDRMDKLEARVT